MLPSYTRWTRDLLLPASSPFPLSHTVVRLRRVLVNVGLGSAPLPSNRPSSAQLVVSRGRRSVTHNFNTNNKREQQQQHTAEATPTCRCASSRSSSYVCLYLDILQIQIQNAAAAAAAAGSALGHKFTSHIVWPKNQFCPPKDPKVFIILEEVLALLCFAFSSPQTPAPADI